MTPISGTTTILGIETSCDETAAAVVQGHGGHFPSGHIASNCVYSQIKEHNAFGGVVPELAARAHVVKLDGMIKAALKDADTRLPGLDAIAVTAGPGLGGGLIVGVMTARAIGMALDKPVIGINHLEGHALTARLTNALPFPYLLLLVSGGHTQIVSVQGIGDYRRYATTIDDALGEAFDKTAKLLGLGYPGGPAVENHARRGDPERFKFPRPMRGSDRPDFSFSGLKTAVRQAAQAAAPLDAQTRYDLCASFQAAVTDTLRERMRMAMTRFRMEHPSAAQTLVVAGGVAANSAIRAVLNDEAHQSGFAFHAAPQALCTDNAAMIAWAGLERFEAGMVEMPIMIRTRWPLDPCSEPVFGGGKRGPKA